MTCRPDSFRWLVFQQERAPLVDEAPEPCDASLERLEALQLPRVGLHVRRDERLVLRRHRLELLPVEPLLGDVADVAEIALPQRRHRQQLRAQRLATCRSGRPADRAPRPCPPKPPRPSAAERLVHVVRNDVEAARHVLVQVVVARARPVAVAVDQRHFERQEPQRAVDVEDRRQRRFELVRRRRVEDPAQLDEAGPRLRRRRWS